MSVSIAPTFNLIRSAPVLGVDVHAVHKSATMFLFQFFGRLAQQYDFDFYSENNDPANQDKLAPDNQRNFCRCPIRTFEAIESEFDFETKRHLIFHVRDPRDILVSEYFSIGWIHPTEGSDLDERRKTFQQMPIDEYVLRECEKSSWPLQEKFRPLLERELNPEFETIVTYETMVTDFQSWAEQVLPPFGVRFPKLVAIKLAWRYRNEFKVAVESMTHKRRIAPGDHRDKLEPATIDALNQRFETVLTRFGYLT
jgi:hypothetical protein